MSYKIIPAVTFVLLAACGKASAVTLDSSNPAHCIAAFEIGVVAARQSKDLDWAAKERARSLYEAGKLDKGNEAKVKEEIETVIKQIKDDVGAMSQVYEPCTERQNGDPAFVSQSAGLLALAKLMDPSLR